MLALYRGFWISDLYGILKYMHEAFFSLLSAGKVVFICTSTKNVYAIEILFDKYFWTTFLCKAGLNSCLFSLCCIVAICCTAEYTGRGCELGKNFCNGPDGVCQNGAECVPKLDDYECHCVQSKYLGSVHCLISDFTYCAHYICDS